MTTSFTQIKSFSHFFWKELNNSVGFVTPVMKKWHIQIKCLVAVPSSFHVSDCRATRIEMAKKSLAR